MEKPYWINGDYSWYIDKKYQTYLETEQAENLPKLTGLGVFRVVNKKEAIDDYVLIDDKQQAIQSYNYNSAGAEQLKAFLNILKVSNHFNKEEKVGFKRSKRSYERN